MAKSRNCGLLASDGKGVGRVYVVHVHLTEIIVHHVEQGADGTGGKIMIKEFVFTVAVLIVGIMPEACAATATVRVEVSPGTPDYAAAPVKVNLSRVLTSKGWTGPIEEHMVSVKDLADGSAVPCRPAWGYKGENAGRVIFSKTGKGRRFYEITIDTDASRTAERVIPLVGLGEPMSHGRTGVVSFIDGSFGCHADAVDWDGDGDLDVLAREGMGGGATWVMHGVYYFENVGSATKPLLAKPRHVDLRAFPDVSHAVDWNGDGVLDIVADRFLYANRGPKGAFNFAEPESIVVIGQTGSNATFHDWNGDGLFDVIYTDGRGGSSPHRSLWLKDLPWSPFTGQGVWRGTQESRRILVRLNTGTAASPAFEGDSLVLQILDKRLNPAGRIDIQIPGARKATFGDIDGDGLLDLLVGNTHDLYYFRNVGTKNVPVYDRGYPLVELPSEIYVRPFAADWNGDGTCDVMISGEAGDVRWLRNLGTKDAVGRQAFAPIAILRQKDPFIDAGSCGPMDFADITGDGLPDVVTGNSYGEVMVWESVPGKKWTFEPTKYVQAAGRKIQIQAGTSGSIQGPGEARYGYIAPELADWDQDGVTDLILNDVFGRNRFYKGSLDAEGRVVFAADTPVSFADPAHVIKPDFNWWNPVGAELVTSWRNRPEILDWDGDRVSDYLVVDHEGYVGFFKGILSPIDGTKRIDKLRRPIIDATTGKPLMVNDGQCGRSGRMKINFVDWDGDGDLDLMRGVAEPSQSRFRDPDHEKGCVIYFENLGAKGFKRRGELIPDPDLRTSGHSSCPQAYDFDDDGTLDLLLGAEDGHIYAFHRAYLERNLPKVKVTAINVN
jgi:hypothetical protein